MYLAEHLMLCLVMKITAFCSVKILMHEVCADLLKLEMDQVGLFIPSL